MFYKAAEQGDNSFFKYLLTLLAVVVAAIVGQIPLGVAISLSATEQGLGEQEVRRLLSALDFSELGLSQNLALFLMLLSFVTALVMLYLCVVFLHRKRFTNILTGRARLDWRRVAFSAALWLLITAVFEGVGYLLTPENYSLQFEPRLFFPLLIIVLLLLPLQTTFEEAIFRGYLMQGFGLLFRNRWLPLLITSLAFGALHFANPEVEKFGWGAMMLYYCSFGLVMGVCTLMDEGTELALGLHAATNIYGAAIVSFSGSALQTPTLFHLEEVNIMTTLIFGLLGSILFLGIASRKYDWEDWGKLLRQWGNNDAPQLSEANVPGNQEDHFD